MKTNFNTARLTAKTIDDSNKKYVLDLYGRKENVEFLHGISAEEDIRLSQECYASYDGIGAYLIFENETNNFVGVGGIQKQELMQDGSYAMLEHDIEFLIILNHEFKGRGYASEFCDKFFKKLFSTFPNLHIPARVNKENSACIKLLKKFGFNEDGETYYHNYNNKFTLLKNNFDSWQETLKK
jgi:RimJ/RimL family protein N-acetyltransferase